jgi:hypothetical protein
MKRALIAGITGVIGISDPNSVCLPPVLLTNNHGLHRAVAEAIAA